MIEREISLISFYLIVVLVDICNVYRLLHFSSNYNENKKTIMIGLYLNECLLYCYFICLIFPRNQFNLLLMMNFFVLFSFYYYIRTLIFHVIADPSDLSLICALTFFFLVSWENSSFYLSYHSQIRFTFVRHFLLIFFFLWILYWESIHKFDKKFIAPQHLIFFFILTKSSPHSTCVGMVTFNFLNTCRL